MYIYIYIKHTHTHTHTHTQTHARRHAGTHAHTHTHTHSAHLPIAHAIWRAVHPKWCRNVINSLTATALRLRGAAYPLTSGCVGKALRWVA